MSLVLPRLGDFLRQERRTPPRLLPLWGIALLCLAGYFPGSQVWGFAAIASLLLGIVIAPLVGSIQPTVKAYVWLLVLVAAGLVITRMLPVGDWWALAWIDSTPMGLLAIALIGAAAVGGFTSIVWAALVLGEAGRRLWLRRSGGTSAAVAPAPEPALRWPSFLARRAYVGLVCVALAVALPSFFIMSGLDARTLWRDHDGLFGLIGDTVAAAWWPFLALVWLALGAFLCWLAELRHDSLFRRVASGVAAGAIALLLLVAPHFAVGADAVSGGDAVAYCPGEPEGVPCPPPWLYSAPGLEEITDSLATPVALILILATAAFILRAWRRAGTASKPPA